jgi:hypothetical protein
MPSLPLSNVTAQESRSGVKRSYGLAGTELVSFDDLRTLAAAEHPCITAVVPIPNPTQVRTRMNHTVHEIEKRLTEKDLAVNARDGLMEPVRALAARIQMGRDWAVSIILFRSPGTFRYFSTRQTLMESVTIGDHCQVRPLLSILSREQEFYLLALSQKHVRLFRCTQRSLQPISLRGHTPSNFHVWMNIRMPDHTLDNRSAAGHSTGSMKGVKFGTSTDRERMDEYLSHYFKAVDKGVHQVLAEESAPLIVAAVESEIALYRRVNTYPKLLDHSLHGSPDAESSEELYKRALEIVNQVPSEALSKVLKEFQEHRGTQRLSLSVSDILKRSFEGRVAHLLLREDAEHHGAWDEAAQRLQTGEEDLLNLTALQTLIHGGQVFSVQASEIPESADAAAILRF